MKAAFIISVSNLFLGFQYAFGERLSAVTHIPVYLVAAALLLSTTIPLYFVVLHSGDYRFFGVRRSCSSLP